MCGKRDVSQPNLGYQNRPLNQPQELSDNDFSSGNGSQPSPIAGPSMEPNPICDDTDNSLLADEVTGLSMEPNPICDDIDNSLLADEIYGPRTNLTDYADVSEATSDEMDWTFRVQRKTKKKQKAANESENESVEEGRGSNPYIFFPIRNEDSTKEAESTTTDDWRVTPFEDIGLEENQRIPSRSSSENSASSWEDRGSATPETPDDRSENTDESDGQSSENKYENPETPDDKSSEKKSENSGKPVDHSLENKYDNRETADESTFSKSSVNPETSDDESAMDSSDTPASKSDSLKTSECERSGQEIWLKTSETEGSDQKIWLDNSGGKPSNSQKRNLSTIHEEIVESLKDAKRSRLRNED
ncbi:hypothetical protein AVEN_238994-1 [Araneus ventricosus]|uniref:Uncharacterized protein n=1 Tax=Araneus ventricosus TaxID=182803 RepID=A0A4Y2R931_ARAVE|nr:hypothetical protein AVEN_238994-1 [Araneus ventricosus]